MKTLIPFALVAALALPLFAEEQYSEADLDAVAEEKAEESVMWPAFFAIADIPTTPDLIGMRLTIPCSTKQECVTGIDVGFWGSCKDFEGIALSIIRNDVKDTFAGIQVGLYNTAGRADLGCVQVGLMNETGSFRGVQAGLINLTGDGQGFQVGLINRAESLYGFQLGLVNVIRDAEVPFFPCFNIGF